MIGPQFMGKNPGIIKKPFQFHFALVVSNNIYLKREMNLPVFQEDDFLKFTDLSFSGLIDLQRE